MNVTWETAWALWQGQLADNTRRAYLRDLQDLAQFMGKASPLEAVQALTHEDAGGAYFIALAWRKELTDSGLSVSTRNRRLATLRSIMRLTRAVGLHNSTLGLQAEHAASEENRIRERMLPLPVIARMMELAGARDTALLWLLYSPACRVSEALSLDWPEDVDLARGLIRFVGKQRNEPETHDLPVPAIEAIEGWLDIRGREPGALFTDMRVNGKGRRICARQAWRVVHTLGQRVGVRNASPHGLRHCGITTAARQVNGNAFKVQQFARHSNIATSTIYVHLSDDERRDTVEAVGQALLAEAGVTKNGS